MIRISPVVAAIMFILFGGRPATAQTDGHDMKSWGSFSFRPDEGMTSGGVAGQPDSVIKVLKDIFTELDVPLKESAGKHQLAANRQRAVRKLGKAPVSRYLVCGEGLMGPNADNWYVYYTLMVGVEPAGGKSALTIGFTGSAVDTPSGRTDRVKCTTTGRLEFDVVKRLREAFPGTQ